MSHIAFLQRWNIGNAVNFWWGLLAVNNKFFLDGQNPNSYAEDSACI